MCTVWYVQYESLQKCADVKEQVQRLAGLENQYLVQYLHTEEGDNTLAVVTTYIPGVSYWTQNKNVSTVQLLD